MSENDFSVASCSINNLTGYMIDSSLKVIFAQNFYDTIRLFSDFHGCSIITAILNSMHKVFFSLKFSGSSFYP